MSLSVETVNRLLASGRNYASTLVGFIGGVGLVSAAQDKGLMDALNEIFSGMSQIVHGATSLWTILVAAFPLIGVWLARIASKSATTSSQAQQVKAAVIDPNTPVPPDAVKAITDAAANLAAAPQANARTKASPAA
jgi:hypothetical protein